MISSQREQGEITPWFCLLRVIHFILLGKSASIPGMHISLLAEIKSPAAISRVYKLQLTCSIRLAIYCLNYAMIYYIPVNPDSNTSHNVAHLKFSYTHLSQFAVSTISFKVYSKLY